MVKLSVYSVLGELLSTLVNENIDAGYHKAEFDASQYSSGTYIYQLTVTNDIGSFTSTKKMLLVK
jgi:hypothetical protein